MAWRWMVASAVLKETNGTRVQADVKYYDDADAANSPTPTVFLHAHSFYFSPGWSNADMRLALEAEGIRARAAYARAAELAVAVPVGTSGAVPTTAH